MKSPGKDESGGGFSAMRIGREGRGAEKGEREGAVGSAPNGGGEPSCSLAPLSASKSAQAATDRTAKECNGRGELVMLNDSPAVRRRARLVRSSTPWR